MKILLAGGKGRMGRNHHRTILALGHQPVTADPAGGDHPNVTRALAAGRYDAAIIATPVQALAQAAKLTLQARIPTLIEKPMASSPQEARALAALAVTHRTPADVAYVELHNPAVIALARRLRADDDPPALIHAIRQGPEPPAGGETLTDLGTHDLAVAALLDPERDASRTILTGYAETKTRILTVVTRSGATHVVDYQQRTLNDQKISGDDPLEAQLRRFLAHPPRPSILHQHADVLAEARGAIATRGTLIAQ